MNLAPADTKKEGSSYDLPIAIGILISMEEIHNANIDNMAFIGELSLDGKLNKVNGVLPMCIEARRLGIKANCSARRKCKRSWNSIWNRGFTS